LSGAHPAYVLLEDGAWFSGTARRSFDPTPGEVVFTTNLTGYQEVFTDPSYLGQIVVMTAPMIGNYGVNREDLESEKPQVNGVIVRELSRDYSNWRATGSLEDWLDSLGIPLLEARAAEKWGGEPAYKAYRERTPALFPRPPASRGDRS